MAKILPGKHIAQVNLDKGNVDGQQRVANCDTGVRKCAWIYQDKIDGIVRRLLHPVDDLVFRITLHAKQPVTKLGGLSNQPRLDLGEVGAAIHARLASPEQVEVGSIDQ